MPNKNYLRGVRLERLAQNDLRERGYRADRTAGSHGDFDVIARNREQVLFIQVKGYLPSKKEMREIAKACRFVPPCEQVKVQLWCRVKGEWKRFGLKSKGQVNVEA